MGRSKPIPPILCFSEFISLGWYGREKVNKIDKIGKKRERGQLLLGSKGGGEPQRGRYKRCYMKFQ